MRQYKTLLMTAAILALPGVAFAQISTDAVTDAVKEKAVDTVLDNVTTDDAMTAGKTLLQGGSKEDAALAVVKGRADDKLDAMTDGAVSMDDLSSKDNMIDAGKDVAMEKAKSSATTYTGTAAEKAEGSSKTYSDKAEGSAKTYSDKAEGSAKTYTDGATDASHGSAKTYTTEKSHDSSTTYSDTTTTTPSAAPVNCPAGTKAVADGTCMITGDFNF